MGVAWHWICLGWEAIYEGRLDEARELLARAVTASDELGDPVTTGFANDFMTWARLACGDTTLAYSLASTTLEHVLEAGAGLTLGMTHQMLARTEIALGELPSARGHLQAAVEAERLSGWVYMLTWHLALLGTLERVDGNLDAAHHCAEEALLVARRLGSGWMQANAERLVGRLALAAGEATEAKRYVHDVLGRLVAKGFAIDIPECLDVLAAIAAAQESFQEAARLLGAAAAGRQRLGTSASLRNQSSGPPSSTPRRRRLATPFTIPPSPRAPHWGPMTPSPTSAGPGANERAHHAAGTA